MRRHVQLHIQMQMIETNLLKNTQEKTFVVNTITSWHVL